MTPTLRKSHAQAMLPRSVRSRPNALLLMSAVVFLTGGSAARGHPTQPGPSYTPPNGFVPDSTTAVHVAQAVLIPVYGTAEISRESPMTAVLSDGVWTVQGRSPRGVVGGTAQVQRLKKDARIIRMSHAKLNKPRAHGGTRICVPLVTRRCERDVQAQASVQADPWGRSYWDAVDGRR